MMKMKKNEDEKSQRRCEYRKEKQRFKVQTRKTNRIGKTENQEQK